MKISEKMHLVGFCTIVNGHKYSVPPSIAWLHRNVSHVKVPDAHVAGSELRLLT